MIGEFDRIKKMAVYQINQKSVELSLVKSKITGNLHLNLRNEYHSLNMRKTGLKNTFSRILLKNNSSLNELKTLFNNSDPSFILGKGYSYTTMKGKTIKSISQVNHGDIVKTHLQDGCFESNVTENAKL
jgi:exonuclease VII large subunit